MIPFIYDSLLWFFSIIIDLFFREVQPRSSWRIPKRGPVLFVVSPHANQFADPIILLRVIRHDSRRRVSFLIAEKSMKRRFIGLGARLVGAIPVARAMDSVKEAKGKIYMPDPDNEPTLIRGHGTNFEELEVGGRLVLPKVKGEKPNADIQEVISSTELRLKKPFRHPAAVDLLTGKGKTLPDGVTKKSNEFDGCSFSTTPKIDTSAVFDAVFRQLLDGGCVGIFPEGGSHDRPDLLPLQAGVSIMALGTLAKDPNCGLTIVPCGMNYFHAHKFRSRCVVEFGTPVKINPDYIEQYKNPKERPTAVNALLKDIKEALLAVTVTAPDYDTLMLIQATRRLYKPDHKTLPLSAIVELNRRLVQGYEKYKDHPLIVDLQKSILGYHRELMQLQIRDHQVAYARFTRTKALGLLLQRLIRLVVFSAAVIPGTILFAPVFIAGKVISQRKSKEALAASSVKIQARDVLATWKILVALGLTPILYTLYSLIVTYFAFANKLFGYQPKWLDPVYVFPLAYIFFAGMSYAALRFGEVSMDILKSTRPLLIALSPYHGHILTNLRHRREELVLEVNQVINTLGPELFPDFDKKRIIKEGASVGKIGGSHEDEFFRSASDLTLSEPTTPSSPTFKLQDTMIRTDSYTNLGSVGVFSSNPATPRRARSRSNSIGGGKNFNGLHGMSPLTDQGQFDSDRKEGGHSTATSSEELSKRIRGAMKERNARRRSQSERGSGNFSSSGASTPDSRAEMDGLMMTKNEG